MMSVSGSVSGNDDNSASRMAAKWDFWHECSFSLTLNAAVTHSALAWYEELRKETAVLLHYLLMCVTEISPTWYFLLVHRTCMHPCFLTPSWIPGIEFCFSQGVCQSFQQQLDEQCHWYLVWADPWSPWKGLPISLMVTGSLSTFSKNTFRVCSVCSLWINFSKLHNCLTTYFKRKKTLQKTMTIAKMKMM